MRFKNRGRCQSELRVRDGEGYISIQCSCVAEHEESHAGRSKNGVFVSWTDQDAREALRDSSKAQTRSKPFKAWRCWMIDQKVSIEIQEIREGDEIEYEWHDDVQHSYRLASTAIQKIWDGPVMTTREGRKVSPYFQLGALPRRHDYGVFAYKTPKYLQRYFGFMMMDEVFGRVDLTGHVVEHELGYRAQKCTIRELWISSKAEKEGMKEEFESVYHCPVHVIESKQIEHLVEYYSQESEE